MKKLNDCKVHLAPDGVRTLTELGIDKTAVSVGKLLLEVADLTWKLVDARDAALVEAAKAMCPYCKSSEAIEVRGVFHHPSVSGWPLCASEEIHRLRAGKEGR